MKHFQTAFALWLERMPEGLTVYRLADLSGVNKASLYLLKSGQKRVTLAIMASLLPIIAEQDSREAARRLLIAYLQDSIPEGFEQDLQIRMTEQPRSTDLLGSALEYLAARAAKDHKYAEWLITQYLLSREADFATVEELVAKWHQQHGRSPAEPDPREIALLAEPAPIYGGTGGSDVGGCPPDGPQLRGRHTQRIAAAPQKHIID